MSEQAEMAKLTWLARGKITSTFINDWKPFMDFLVKMEESKVIIYGFDDWKEIN